MHRFQHKLPRTRPVDDSPVAGSRLADQPGLGDRLAAAQEAARVRLSTLVGPGNAGRAQRTDTYFRSATARRQAAQVGVSGVGFETAIEERKYEPELAPSSASAQGTQEYGDRGHQNRCALHKEQDSLDLAEQARSQEANHLHRRPMEHEARSAALAVKAARRTSDDEFWHEIVQAKDELLTQHAVQMEGLRDELAHQKTLLAQESRRAAEPSGNRELLASNERQLQEKEAETAKLRRSLQLAQNSMDALEQKHRGVQDELRHYQYNEKERLHHEEATMSHELQVVRGHLKLRDEQLLQLQRIHADNQDQKIELKRRIEAFEQYVLELPTQQECEFRQQAFEQLQQRMDELTTEYQRSQQQNGDMATNLQQLEETTRHLRSRNEQLSDQLSHFQHLHDHETAQLSDRVRAATQERNELEVNLENTQATLDHVRAECIALADRLKDQRSLEAEFDKKVAHRDSLVAELQSQLVDRNNRLRDLMTQNNILEEARSSALQKLEIQAATIYELRSAVEALRKQNQELIATNLSMRGERMPVHIGAAPAPVSIPVSDFLPEQNDQIQDALADTVMDLRGLMCIISERVRGRHPSIDHLLGLQRPGKLYVRTSDPGSQIENIQAMRAEIDDIRKAISEQYAADIGRDACGIQ